MALCCRQLNMILSLFRPAALARVPRAYSMQPMSRSVHSKAPLLVTPKALQDLRSSANVNILDASWFMPNSPRNASQEFLEKRIPGARYLDLDEVAAPNELGLKHMMPSAQVFNDALGKLTETRPHKQRIDDLVEEFGITPASHVVL
jgi:thiosulfate/3-mercaptopyruvate sulfurtransferase